MQQIISYWTTEGAAKVWALDDPFKDNSKPNMKSPQQNRPRSLQHLRILRTVTRPGENGVVQGEVEPPAQAGQDQGGVVHLQHRFIKVSRWSCLGSILPSSTHKSKFKEKFPQICTVHTYVSTYLYTATLNNNILRYKKERRNEVLENVNQKPVTRKV